MNKEPLIVTGKVGLSGVIETSRSPNGALLITVQLANGERRHEPFASGQQVVVRLTNEDEVLVNSDAFVVQKDGSYYLPFSLAELQRQRGMDVHDAESFVMPVLQEELVVHKRKFDTSNVSITKQVHEREEIVDQMLLEEQVDIERVTINRAVSGPIPLRYEGDTMIVSVLEEVLVLEKRLMLKEELHVTKRAHEIHKPQYVTLRSEEVNIKRDSQCR